MGRISKGQAVTPKKDAEMWRPVTAQEVAAWHASKESKGMDEAGELKLPPRNRFQYADGTTDYRVVRARVVAERGYFDVPKCCQVEDYVTGERWYVKRSNIPEEN